MRTYNKATVIGHVGSEVILRQTKDGKSVVNLSVATNERRKDGVEVTTWHRAVLWDRLAEFAERAVTKGEPVYVEGRLRNNDWTDRDGVRRQRMEIIAHEFIMLGGRGEVGDAPSDSAMAGSERPSGALGGLGRHSGVGPSVFRRGLGQGVDGEELGEVTEDIPF